MRILFIFLLSSLSTILIAQNDSVPEKVLPEPFPLYNTPKMDSKLPDDAYLEGIREAFLGLYESDSVVNSLIEFKQIEKVVLKTQEVYLRSKPQITTLLGEDDTWLFRVQSSASISMNGAVIGLKPYSATIPVHTFFSKGEDLVYYQMDYVNSTRMGSCGTISIQHQAYFKNGAVYRKEVLQSPFDCYHETIQIERIEEDFAFWLEVLEQLDFGQ